ncbi:MAG: hypothetical protein DWQ08_08770 [Proteobacteria bacterium]|nr:MAG: hypothetical protein DWQ08_08770 [Pseudomonadota bacterium]
MNFIERVVVVLVTTMSPLSAFAHPGLHLFSDHGASRSAEALEIALPFLIAFAVAILAGLRGRTTRPERDRERRRGERARYAP